MRAVSDVSARRQRVRSAISKDILARRVRLDNKSYLLILYYFITLLWTNCVESRVKLGGVRSLLVCAAYWCAQLTGVRSLLVGYVNVFYQ